MNYGFIRVAAATTKIKVANPEYNSKQIIGQIDAAIKDLVKIINFPELSITGYTCGDLFEQSKLISKAYECLQDIINFTLGKEIVVILGMPILNNSKLYNAAIVIQNGDILGVVPKTYIPNYSEFYEKRWFESGNNIINDTVLICGRKVPFGVDLIFQERNNINICFGIEICEDLWSTIPPSSYQAVNGATLLFNLSASNEIIGKNDYRKEIIKQQSARCIAGYIYSSSGVSESTTDLVFGGHLLIAENGSILTENQRFSRDNQIIICDIDVERLQKERLKNTTFMCQTENRIFRRIQFELTEVEIDNLNRCIDAFPFVPSDISLINKRCEEIFAIQTSGLAKRLEHLNCKSVVLGISGGLDSTLAFLVSVKAFQILDIPLKNILGVTLPGFGTTKETQSNAVNLIKEFGATLKKIDITDACLKHFEDIGHNKDIHDITYENTQARERTQILMDIANKEKSLLVGTGDLSELALGWCTYNGDHMSMYNVNSGVPKTLVKFLVKWVADSFNKKHVLYKIIDTPISPELLPPSEDGKINQKTEDIIGPYSLHDFFLYYFIRFGFSPKKILFLAQHAFNEKYTKEDIKKYLKIFITRFFSNQFKRSCLPDGPKVGTISLSPRGDWRMPSDADAEIWLKELE